MKRTMIGLLVSALFTSFQPWQTAESSAAPMSISETFKRLKAPETGRAAVQLTSGDGFCYPLYYFIASFTRDAKYLVYHRAEGGQVQLFRLELATGESVQLTHADHPKTQWYPWCVESGRGVLDHRSVLNVARDAVIYFDGNEVRQVDVHTLQDELLFVLPEDREAIGQNCTTPDGKWFVYIDAPRGSSRRKPCKGAIVAAYHLDTREQRVLARIDVAIHHVVAWDNEHFVFCHPAGHSGMMMTDFTSGEYVHLREGDPGAQGHLCHFLMTQRGIAYEVPELKWSGLYDPLTRRRFEFQLPIYWGYVHTGWDPQGRLWFYENAARPSGAHEMYALVRLDPADGEQWLRLTGDWPTYGGGQKSHFHPQLTPDRKWILFTGGDPATETNHMFLLDASDLKDIEGISTELLSPTGANDLTRPTPPQKEPLATEAAESRRPSVRIAGIVLKWLRGDKEANLRRIEPMIRRAAANDAQIVSTTECFLDGYAIADKSIPLEIYRGLGEPIPEGKCYRRLAALARELQIHLVAGMLEADGQHRYNTAVLIGPDGSLIGKYHKQELGHELVRNTPGDSSLVFDTPFGRVGLMICADRRFEAIVCGFSDNGADFLICPSGGMYGPNRNDPILQDRSRENKIHIVFVHPAEFLVTGPDGSILDRTILGDRLLISPEQTGSETDQNRVFYYDLPIGGQKQ